MRFCEARTRERFFYRRRAQFCSLLSPVVTAIQHARLLHLVRQADAAREGRGVERGGRAESGRARRGRRAGAGAGAGAAARGVRVSRDGLGRAGRGGRGVAHGGGGVCVCVCVRACPSTGALCRAAEVQRNTRAAKQEWSVKDWRESRTSSPIISSFSPVAGRESDTL